MHAQLVAPLVEFDPAMLAARHRLGLDRQDEVWDGVLHMNPPASTEHALLQARLASALIPLADSAGLLVGTEPGLIAPEEPGWNDFRVPDIAVFSPEVATERGIVGAPTLVVEIRSPGDDSFRKLPFYERVGAEEVVIIDRDAKVVRRWLHDGGQLLEVSSPSGVHDLTTIPLRLSMHAGRLTIDS